MLDWLAESWLSVVVPLLVFLAAYVVGLWVRRAAYNAFGRWVAKAKWEGSQLVVQITRTPFLYWFLMLGAYIAVQASVLASPAKVLAGRVLVSLFIISLTWVVASFTHKLIQLYADKMKVPRMSSALLANVARVIIIVLGVLVLLDVWGAPTTPVIIILAIGIVGAALALRDVIPSLFAGLQLMRGEQLRAGDFIKIESGEEGYVVDVTWRNTQIKALDSNLIMIPNSRLMQNTVINYGRQVKQATEPFCFSTRLHLKELTGIKAANLRELLDVLKEVPDAVIYYHTHSFLEEYQYLTPEPASDFAVWVSDELGDEILGERLASIDIFGFPSIGALRARFIEVIESHLEKNPDGRVVQEGRELHFIKSVSVVLPTPYVAHDLREFAEVLKKVTINSLFYHIFEAKLRLHKGVNDFSIWVEDCLGDKDLADRLAYLDPYTYTLEGLRSTIIQLVEKRIM